MSERTKIAAALGVKDPTQVVEKGALGSAPVIMSSSLVTLVPASFGSGNIGRLAVNIVANRLLARGAEPRYVSANLTIDIDTAPELVDAVAAGMHDAAVEAELEWATVESVVKPVGPATGIAISAFGVGTRMVEVTSPFVGARQGDAVIITGEAGATGAAILGSQKGVDVLTRSDGTVLTDIMREVYVHDPDLSNVVYPIEGVRKSLADEGIKVAFVDGALPVDGAVAAACEVMGVDPLDMPTAGAMLLCVAPADVDTVLKSVRRFTAGQRAAVIGYVAG